MEMSDKITGPETDIRSRDEIKSRFNTQSVMMCKVSLMSAVVSHEGGYDWLIMKQAGSIL
jgi:hypothetical protein